MQCSRVSRSTRRPAAIFWCFAVLIRSSLRSYPPHLWWEDEDWRFTLFANGAAEFAGTTGSQKLSLPRLAQGWSRSGYQSPDISTVFTIHNLAYRTVAPGTWKELPGVPGMQGHNTMAAAVQFADRVTTVSPTYANRSRHTRVRWKARRLAGLSSVVSCPVLSASTPRFLTQRMISTFLRTFTADRPTQAKQNCSARRIGVTSQLRCFLGLVW